MTLFSFLEKNRLFRIFLFAGYFSNGAELGLHVGYIDASVSFGDVELGKKRIKMKYGVIFCWRKQMKIAQSHSNQHRQLLFGALLFLMMAMDACMMSRCDKIKHSVNNI